ncbi:hypothetical protein DPMN_156308 [Dreissena polymorpha]|uniref:Uncharacterized protein n=1 Tax=Dreissena polymorpha TaxID=45954 RepID=A0A9D4FPL1_DREPO|nr:hypothetical protein DPMN_156308 [Dreissena polymorpha]
MSTIQRFDGIEFVPSCSGCSTMVRKLNQFVEKFDDLELFNEHLANLLDMVYQNYNNLEDECSNNDGKLPYPRKKSILLDL